MGDRGAPIRRMIRRIRDLHFTRRGWRTNRVGRGGSTYVAWHVGILSEKNENARRRGPRMVSTLRISPGIRTANQCASPKVQKARGDCRGLVTAPVPEFHLPKTPSSSRNHPTGEPRPRVASRLCIDVVRILVNNQALAHNAVGTSELDGVADVLNLGSPHGVRLQSG